MSSSIGYPLHPPPPGQSSNFSNPESRGPATVAICYIFISLMWPICLLRLYSKVCILRKFGWDDVSAVLAAIGATAFAACTIWLTAVKFSGPHAWDVRAKVATDAVMKVSILGTGWSTLCLITFFAKLALFLLYYRLFASNRRAKIAIYVGIVTTGLFYFVFAVVFLVLCFPRSGESWRQSRCEQKIAKMNDIPSGFGLVSDLYIFILPLPVLGNLQMPLRKKLGVIATFSTGLIAIIVSSLGFYYRSPEKLTAEDITWDDGPANALNVVEMTIGVICSSAPYLPAFFRARASSFTQISHLLQGLLCSRRTKLKKGHELPLHDTRKPKPKTAAPHGMHPETHPLRLNRGEGNAITPERFPSVRDTQCSPEPSGNVAPFPNASPTRRDHYEIAMNVDTVSSNGPAQSPRRRRENSVATASGKHPGGYWDMMSIFRSEKNISTTQSKSYPRSQSGHL